MASTFCLNSACPPPASMVKCYIEGGIEFAAEIQIGYDTSGIMKAIKNKAPAMALDGFFIQTLRPDGKPYYQLSVTGYIGVGGGVSAGIEATVGGRVIVTIGLGLYDPAETTGDDRGKLRISTIFLVFAVKGLGGFEFLFQFCIEISLEVECKVSLDLGFTTKTLWKKTWNFPIWEYIYQPDL